MKKLLIVSRSTTFHNRSGGLETQLAGLVDFLKDYFEITVLTTRLPFKDQPENATHIKDTDGVNYIFLKDTIPGEYGFSFYESIFWQMPFKRNFDSLNKNFKSKSAKYFLTNLKGDFDLIVSQSSSAQDFKIDSEKLIAINHGTTLNEIRSRYRGAVSIKDKIRFVGLNFPTLVFEYLINNPRFFKKCSKIVLISGSVKKDFCSQHKQFCKKVIVIENGVDTKKFKPLLLKYSAKVLKVFYVGRVDFEKGLNEFIAVAQILKKYKNIRFDIYGDGPDKDALVKNLSNSKLTNIDYHGSVSNDQVSKIMSVSHVFLFLTKRSEGLPMSVIESMSSGCVIVSPWDLQYKDIYNKFESVPGAAEEILRLSNNMSLYNKLSKQFRNLALNNYSLEKSGKKYLNLLSNIE